MLIEIKLDKDFERYLNALKEEYGEEFSSLNGLSDDKSSDNDY